MKEYITFNVSETSYYKNDSKYIKQIEKKKEKKKKKTFSSFRDDINKAKNAKYEVI